MLEENNNFETEHNEAEAPQVETPVAPINAYNFMAQEYYQKKDIRKIALTIGIPSLCIFLITFLWSSIYVFVTTKLVGMSYSEAVTLTEDAAFQQVLQILISILMFLVPFPIAAKCAGYKIDALVKTNRPIQKTALPFFAIGIGFCAFSNIAMTYCSYFFEGIGIDYDVDFGDNPSGVLGFLLSFIATAIVPALVEEFACRGIVLGLLKKHGEGFAIIVSSIVFGIMHGNFEQIPFAVLVGLILGYIYVKTNSIWISIAVHCANNAVSVIFTYLNNTLSANMQNVVYLLYLTFGLLAAIVGVCLLTKNNTFTFELEKSDSEITLKQKYIWFFTSWAIIVFVAISLFEALSYFVI